MPPQVIFLMQTALGYIAWLLCFRAYVWPRLKSMDAVEAQRAIATLHSFRFFGLVFVLPGIVGANLPAGFAPFAAHWDLATGILAIVALAHVVPVIYVPLLMITHVTAFYLLVHSRTPQRGTLPRSPIGQAAQ